MTQFCVGYFKIFISIITLITLFFRGQFVKIIHAQEIYEEQRVKYMRGRGELWIRYVSKAKEYMRKKKKDEIGMCQRQRNTCEKRKKMKQVCARGKGIHAREGEIMD